MESDAMIILDSMNALNSEDLIKINTRGCVNNCLPYETFSKWFGYNQKVKKLGYYTKWNNMTHRYSLIAIDSEE